MAEMIPESISAAPEATTGEKRVFKVLRDALLPDEDYLVWFEPKAIKKRPDFLIWSQELGLLVVEVKDWVPSQIIQMSPISWTIERSGVREVHESPTEQARKCFIGFKELLQSRPEFRHANGPHSGNLRFPIGYCAVFTNITRKQATEFGIVGVLDGTQCIFSDDLTFDIDSRDGQREFISKLKKSFSVKFEFEPLSIEQLKTLRYLIFPEVRVNSVRRLRTSEQAELVKTLDIDQERMAKSISEGHRVLKGVAGSGKTLVLACRAKYLKKLHPEWKILIVCYNISLCQYLRQLLSIAGFDCESASIQIYHYHGLVKDLTGANLKKLQSESSEQWDSRIGTILRGEIAKGNVNARYDAILIDEGQDFALEWLQSLTDLLNERSDSLLLCLDPAQNIFGRKVTFKSVGIKVQGKKPILLKKSYRNTAEILALARTFSGVSRADSVELGDSTDEAPIESVLFPLDIDRHGDSPLIVKGIPFVDQIVFILDQVDQYIASGECSWCDIGVLYATQFCENFDFAKSFVEAFGIRFGADKLYWVTESRESKVSLDVSSESVKLSTIESAKGMEFRVVFLVGLEMLPRSERVEESERKLAYVGMTRAQDALYVLGKENKGLFAEIVEISQQRQVSEVMA